MKIIIVYLTCPKFVSFCRQSGPGQGGEPGHAPGVGPNSSGAQQSLDRLVQ